MFSTAYTPHLLIGAALLLVSACGDDDTSATSETDGTGTETSPTSTNGTTLTTTTATTTGPDDTTTGIDTTSDDGTTRDETTSATGDETTGETGDVPACVDENLFNEFPAVVQGTTRGFGSDHSGSCGGEGSEDYVLRWEAPADGVYVFHTSGSDFDTVLYVRDADEDCSGNEISCNDDAFDAFTSAVAVPLGVGDAVDVFVDGYVDASGSFTLTIESTEDGGNTCADPLPLENGMYTWVSATNDFDTAGNSGCTGFAAEGVDRVHAVTLAAGETLTVSLAHSSGDASIYLVTDCADAANTCVAGADEVAGGVETIQYTSVSGGTYYFVADRYTSGPSDAIYTLEVDIQ